MSTTAPQTRHTVTAIIVTHDGARLLPALVQALQDQTYPVERVVGVDTGSRDRSGSVLAELIGQDAVFGMDRHTGYGEAVAVALRHTAATRTEMTDPNLRRVEWIWLLHDDCEPTPEALERLLRAASRDRSVVVLGPKVLDGSDRRVLREAGVSIDRAGRRITGIEPGEIDQGQHDANRAVMAVGSAGMLVRRDIWERLGGFDTRLKLFRDDLDFCWRVHAAGLRVQVVTDAIVYHRELAARRRRTKEGSHPRRLDRRNALYVLAVNLPLLTMLRVIAGCVAGSLIRASYFLLTKQLDLAATQIYAVAGLLGHPLWLWKGRRRRATGRRHGYSAVRTFIPPGRTLFRLAESIAGLLSSGPPQASGGMHQATAEQPEDEQFVDSQSVIRRVIANPGVQLVVALLVIALVAERRLLGTSPLGGGALVPAWGGASGLWGEYLAGFHAVGVGSTASAPPYLAVVAALATVLGGQAWLAVDVLLLGCVPLAGLTAYLATRRLVTAIAARVWLAASYALLPVAIGAVATGRLGTAFAFTLLPLIGINAAGMLTAPPRAARRAAWATGLFLALAAAFVPLLWVFGALFAVVALAARRWLWPVHPVNAAIVVATPFVVLFPWSLYLFDSPSRFFAEAGILPPVLTGAAPRPSALLLLSPGGPGLPPAWVTAGIGLAVLAALIPHRRTALTATGWCVAAAGFIGAIVSTRTHIASTEGGQAATGWPGAALAVAAFGLLLAAAPAAQWLAQSRSGPDRGRGRKLLAGVTLAAAATAPVLAGGFWLTDGVRGPVGSITSPVLPAFVSSASSTGGDQYRTLILRQAGGSLDYTVVRKSDPILGEPELTTYAPAEQALSQQVAALASLDGADAGDPGLMLGDFGIRWVLLPGPVDAALAQRLDASVGLVPLSKAPAYDLWQVTGPVARVRAIAPDGAVTALSSQSVGMSAVNAPPSGGTLVLAEPYGGWTAKLNGAPLKPVTTPVDGWAQGFALPPGGGKLVITRDNMARDLSLTAELLALVAVCVLALPGKRAEPAAETEAAAAVTAAQHGRRATRRSGQARRGARGAPEEAQADAGRSARGAGLAARVRRPGLTARGGRAGRNERAGRPGRAAAGFGMVRRRAAAPRADIDQDVTTGSGIDVLADSGESDQTRQWDQDHQWDQDRQPDGHGQWDDGERWGETGAWDEPVPQIGQRPAKPRGTPRGTGPQSLPPWESGPQQAAPWETGQQPPWDSGPQSSSGTGPRRAAPGTGPRESWDTGPRESWGTGPRESWDTGPRESLGTGQQESWESATQSAPKENGSRRKAQPERGSHRIRRNGRPSHRRGSGDRDGADGES